MKIGLLENDRNVKLAATIPEGVAKDLDAYAECYRQEHGHEVNQSKLVGEMLRRFMQDDVDFQRWLRSRKAKGGAPAQANVPAELPKTDGAGDPPNY